ncbi:MAG: hypothetical protein ACI9LE_001292 [Paraglaciecola sp.]|jgi:hypothetical protein
MDQVDILRQLDLPMQMHLVFSLINYYFFGALFYQIAVLLNSYFTKETPNYSLLNTFSSFVIFTNPDRIF